MEKSDAPLARPLIPVLLFEEADVAMKVIRLTAIIVFVSMPFILAHPEPHHPSRKESNQRIGTQEESGKRIAAQFSEPEVLLPSEKISSIPALSKFYVDQERFLGANSEMNEIAIGSPHQEEKFLSPGAVEIEDFIYRNGFFYLLAQKDGVAEIIVLNKEGAVFSRFPLAKTPPTMTTIAVDSKGRIYHNNPSDAEGIITVYDIQGNVKNVFGRHLPERYFASMKLLNRVIMAVDGRDNLIVAFRFEPIVRKYSSNGELLFERDISCKEVTRRVEEEKRRYPERFTLTNDNRIRIRAFTYFTAVAVDENDNIFLKFGPESLIFRLNGRGELEKKYLLSYGGDSIEDFDFWESSIVVSGGALYFPVAVKGSESYGYILKYDLHEPKGGVP